MPFVLIVPEGVTFPLQSYEDAGFVITPRPPIKTDVPIKAEVPENPKVNDVPAFIANGIQIDFQKDSFDRAEKSDLDPPEEVLTRAVNRVLAKLRYLTRGHAITPVTLRTTNWQLAYLNDDGSELERTPKLINRRGGRSGRYAYAGVDADIWSKANSLGADWNPPPWDDILQDANAALPHVGTVVVLGATALEVFIANVLDRLATRTPIPPEVWQWINERGNHLKEPSTEEQFDTLLKLLSGHTLKERSDLWEGFSHLRTARNTFVHRGVAIVGRKPVTSDEALRLLVKANEIVKCVRDWMPVALRWIEFEITTTVSIEVPVRP